MPFFVRLFASIGLWFTLTTALGVFVVAVGGRMEPATGVTLSLVLLIASFVVFFRRRRVTGDAAVTEASRHRDGHH